jgi:hypothetical protein
MTIDEQIAHQQNTVKIIEDFDDKESLPKEQAILASLERLKAIDEMQVPDEPMHVDFTRRSLQYAPPPTTASVRSYRQDKELIEYIDTLRDLLRREIENREHLASMMFDDTRRAEAAEAKLAAMLKLIRKLKVKE